MLAVYDEADSKLTTYKSFRIDTEFTKSQIKALEQYSDDDVRELYVLMALQYIRLFEDDEKTKSHIIKEDAQYEAEMKLLNN